MNSQLVKSNITEKISSLPPEIKSIIFYFIPLNILMSDETKLIKNIIDIYNVDHDPDLTKQAKMYYVKNIMSFSYYVFYTKETEGEYYGCMYGRSHYDKIELNEDYDYFDK